MREFPWAWFVMQHRYWSPEYGVLLELDAVRRTNLRVPKQPAHIKFILLKEPQPMAQRAA